MQQQKVNYITELRSTFTVMPSSTYVKTTTMASQVLSNTKRPRKTPQSAESTKPESKIYRPNSEEAHKAKLPISPPTPITVIHYFKPLPKQSGRGGGRGGKFGRGRRGPPPKKKTLVRHGRKSLSPPRGR